MNERKERLVRRLAIWRELLARLDALGPASDAPEDLDGFGEVKDYILGQVESLARRVGVPA